MLNSLLDLSERYMQACKVHAKTALIMDCGPYVLIHDRYSFFTIC